MNLIFIYGPPAVGKLTIAEELANLTGYRLFHNHLAQDLADEVYPGFNKKKFELTDAIRLKVFESAAESNTSLIFTYVYAGHEYSDPFIKSTVDTFSSHNGSVHFVRLTASRDILFSRVGNESRKRFKKAHHVDELSGRLNEFDLEGQIEGVDNLTIDTASQDAVTSAQQIIDHFGLLQ